MRKNQKGEFLSSRVRYIAIGAVRPNPQQPRRSFDETALRELADSIRAYGILQPLTVRDKGGYYELVAGERRLRAARMAGLREVPCLIAAVGEEDAALLALIENLQRRDLDYLEEAAAISRLIGRYGLSQQQAAEKLGKSQPAIANKLRLLKLPQEVLSALRDAGCTERHARSLLRLPDGEQQRRAADRAIRDKLTVAQTEALVESMLRSPPPKKRRPTLIVKDVRLFLNTISHSLDVMRSAGVDAQCQRQDAPDAITLTIRIPTPPRT